MIKKEGQKYSVWSANGKKRLSRPMSKRKAHVRLGQVEWFKKHPNHKSLSREYLKFRLKAQKNP
jgi:hypothetical protein